MRATAEEATRLLVEQIASLPEQPASSFDRAEELLAALHGPAPEQGSPFLHVLHEVVEGAGQSFNTPGPGFLAYIPGGGLWSAVIADLLATALNRYTGLWNAAPVLVQMEWQAIRWLADIFDYPPTSAGILTSGGSMSNFSAIVTARHALLDDDLARGTIYVSDQTHASVLKSAVLAGFPRANVRSLPSDARLHLNPVALGEAIRRDRACGLRPFLVVANAGTTNTGAIDPIDTLANLVEEEDLWLHVDAAYGGFFRLTERGRAALSGIQRADSITLDPHKTMFLPYGTGGLLVREGRRLREAHDVHEAEYLQDVADSGVAPNFVDLSPELTRDFRGLRVWLPLKLHGLAAFRDALDEKLDLTRVLYEGIRDLPNVTTPWEPELTVVPFRLAPPGTSAEQGDQLTRRLLERINASRRVFLSSTLLGGQVFLRPCIVSFRTHRDRIEEAVDIIRTAVTELMAETR